MKIAEVVGLAPIERLETILDGEGEPVEDGFVTSADSRMEIIGLRIPVPVVVASIEDFLVPLTVAVVIESVAKGEREIGSREKDLRAGLLDGFQFVGHG